MVDPVSHRWTPRKELVRRQVTRWPSNPPLNGARIQPYNPAAAPQYWSLMHNELDSGQVEGEGWCAIALADIPSLITGVISHTLVISAFYHFDYSERDALQNENPCVNLLHECAEDCLPFPRFPYPIRWMPTTRKTPPRLAIKAGRSHC